MPRLTSRAFLGLLAALVASAASPATAQDTAAISAGAPDDWEFAADPGGRSHLATIGFSGGLAIDVTCYDGHTLTIVFQGLPSETDDAHMATASRPDGRSAQGVVTPRGADRLQAQAGARFARTLRGGGAFSLQVEPPFGSPKRLTVDLPAQHANLDRVIQACGLNLDEPRDALPELTDLRARPSVNVGPPRRPRGPGASWVRVEVGCVVTSAARLTDCRIESEHPQGTGYGRTVARAFEGEPIDVPDAEAATGRIVYFVVSGTSHRR